MWRATRLRCFTIVAVFGGLLPAAGCDSAGRADAPASTGAAPSGPGSEGGAGVAPAAAEKGAPASLLDVLHLTNHMYVKYKGSFGGNSMDNGYWSDAIRWNGAQFTVDEKQAIEDRPGKVQQRHVTCKGRLSDDGKTMTEFVIDVETLGPSEGRRHHETFTWRDLPVSPSDEKPGPSWRERPSVTYALSIPRGTIPTHVSGWASTNEWSNMDPSTSTQEQMVMLFVAGDEWTFDMSVWFNKQ